MIERKLKKLQRIKFNQNLIFSRFSIATSGHQKYKKIMFGLEGAILFISRVNIEAEAIL